MRSIAIIILSCFTGILLGTFGFTLIRLLQFLSMSIILTLKLNWVLFGLSCLTMPLMLIYFSVNTLKWNIDIIYWISSLLSICIFVYSAILSYDSLINGFVSFLIPIYSFIVFFIIALVGFLATAKMQ